MLNRPCTLFLKIFGMLVLSLPLQAQKYQPLCALASHQYNPSTDQPPSQLAIQQMTEIDNILCSEFSCPPYQLLGNHQAGNAMANFTPSGGMIRYNPVFMSQVVSAFGPHATSGILAHELGHLIDFTTNQASIPQAYREAAADEYAGCAFALAGNPASDLNALAKTLHAMGPSPGYPTPGQRVQLLLTGYNKCRN